MKETGGTMRSLISLSFVIPLLIGQLDSATVSTVIGTGEAGKLAARALKEAGVARLWVTNRTEERSREVAEWLGGQTLPFGSMEPQLAQADIVVSSTGSPNSTASCLVVVSMSS